MTIGCFYDQPIAHLIVVNNGLGSGDSFNHSYAFLDDVCVIDISDGSSNSSDTNICASNFPVQISGSNIPGNYLWNTGDTTASISADSAGIYYRITLGDCFFHVDSISIFDHVEDFSLGEDIKACKNDRIVLAPMNGLFDSFLWNTGETTSTLTIVESGVYILTAGNSCGTATDTISVTIVSEVPAPVVSDTIVCQHTALVGLSVIGDSILWYGSQNGAGTSIPPIIYTALVNTQTYWVTQTINGCESDKVPVKVTIAASPVIELGTDIVLCNDKDQQVIIGTKLEHTNYLWNTESTECCIEINKSGSYWLETSNSCGTSTDSIQVSIIRCDSCVFMPTAFSPNSDGKNDVLKAISQCPLRRFHLMIVNRWGEVVFESFKIDEGWNGIYKGAQADVGVYQYLTRYELTVPGSEKQMLKGDITLIR